MVPEKKNHQSHIYNIRPDKLSNDGTNYWPKGINKKSALRTQYVDKHGNKFYICYSVLQLKNLIAKIFIPYIPLTMFKFNGIFNFKEKQK